MAGRVIQERRARSSLQRTDVTSTASPPVDDLAGALVSPAAGEPWHADTRSYLEPRLGHSLANVRIHTDSRADELARSVQAEAFTAGNDIYVRSGAYDPSSRPGMKLLAHEATHTIQQAAGPVEGTPGPDGVAISSPDDAFEEAAAATAEEATADFGTTSAVVMQGTFEAGPPELPAAGGHPPIWRLALQRCGPVPCDCTAEERARAEKAPVAQRTVIQRVVADGSDIQSRIQGRIDQDIDRAKQEQAEQGDQHGDAQAAALPEIDRSQVEAKKGELQGPAQPPIDPASQQGAVSQAADQAQASADKPATPVAEAPTGAAPVAAGAAAGDTAAAGGGAAEATMQAAAQAASMASAAFSQASSVLMPDLPQPVAVPEMVAPLDAGGQQLPADTEADTFTETVAGRVQALRDQGHAVKGRAANTRANAVRLEGDLQLARGQVTQAQGGIQQSQEHASSRREALGRAQAALGVSQQKAAHVAEQAPQVQSQADQGHAKTGPIAGESQELAGGASSNAPDDSEAAANAQQSGQQLNQASGNTQSVDSTIAQTQTRAQSLSQEAAQAAATNDDTASTIGAAQSTLDMTEQRLGEMSGQASQAEGQLAALAGAPADIQAQADQQDAAGDALIQASVDLETQLQSVQQEYVAGMASVPAAPPPPARVAAGPPVQRDAQDDDYASRARVNVADLWSSPGDLTPQERQAREQARQEQAQQQAQHRRDQLNEINRLSGGHFDQLDAADKMGIAVQLTLGNLFQSVSNINWPDMGANLIRGLIDPTVSLQGVLSGFNMVLSGGANLLSAEQWARDPLGNLLKSAADIVTGLTIILGSIAGLCLALTVICGALIIFSFGTLAPVLGPAIAFFSSVMATVGPWAIEFAEVALVLQGLVLIKNLIDAATAQTAEQLYNSSEKMTEDAKSAGQMALQVGMASIMEGGGEGPEAPTLEPEAGAIPTEPPVLESLPEPEPVVEPVGEPGAGTGAESVGETATPEPETPALAADETLQNTTSKSGSELSPAEVQTEMQAAEAADSRAIDEPPFVKETELENGHAWKETEEGELCRFSSSGTCFDAEGEMLDENETGEILGESETGYGDSLSPEEESQLGIRDESVLSGESGEPEPMTPEEELDQLTADQPAEQAQDPGLVDVAPGSENFMDLPEYQNGVSQASELFERLPTGPENPKNIASGMEGEPIKSGWGGDNAAATEQAQVEGMEAGHETQPHPFDQGTEGQFESSHSERQAAAGNSDQHFASSKDLCPQCQSWFSARAVAEGRPQFVADPQGVRVFTPNGGQTVVPHPSGAVTTPRPIGAGG